MIDMTEYRQTRPGIALLAVLILIVAITIISLAFISRSDGELAYGRNMKLHTQVDYMADSGLAHARALILNPQDVDVVAGQFWTGASGQQVGADGICYDISVERHPTGSTTLCSFDVTSSAYAITNGTRTASSTLTAELRLDPCIALWTGGNATLGTTAVVYGDTYCGGALASWRTVRGDIYAGGTIWSNSTGQKYTPASAPVPWPPVTCAALEPEYYINGTTFTAQVVGASAVTGYASSPVSSNPAGMVFYVGDLELNGPTNIDGTLVVTGNLTVKGHGNVITATKNFPAVVVGGNLKVESNTSLTVNGLAVVGQGMDIPPSRTGVRLTVNGGLFVAGALSLAPGGGSEITITADHSRTALLIWGPSGAPVAWRQAGGAFYKDLQRAP